MQGLAIIVKDYRCLSVTGSALIMLFLLLTLADADKMMLVLILFS